MTCLQESQLDLLALLIKSLLVTMKNHLKDSKFFNIILQPNFQLFSSIIIFSWERGIDIVRTSYLVMVEAH